MKGQKKDQNSINLIFGNEKPTRHGNKESMARKRNEKFALKSCGFYFHQSKDE
jgi:hypothetical protein